MNKSCGADSLASCQEKYICVLSEWLIIIFHLFRLTCNFIECGWINTEHRKQRTQCWLLSAWGRRPLRQSNNCAVVGPPRRIRCTLSTLRFWMSRGCLGWHASATLCGSWGKSRWRDKPGRLEGKLYAQGLRGDCNCWSLRFRRTSVVFILVMELCLHQKTWITLSNAHFTLCPWMTSHPNFPGQAAGQ